MFQFTMPYGYFRTYKDFTKVKMSIARAQNSKADKSQNSASLPLTSQVDFYICVNNF